jgi:hypothetical protein
VKGEPPPGNGALRDAPDADSVGRMWTGRLLTSTGFDGDIGAADLDLLAALDDPRDEKALMGALAQARLLVPIVAAPSEVDDSGKQSVNRSANMAVMTLTSPDGQRALPVFSALAALSAWDPAARPSPATSARAAQAAVSERCDVMLLDLGSEHHCVLRPSMVWALAQQRDWLPAHTDPFVAQTLSRATADEEDVVGCVGEEGEPAGAGVLRVVMRLRPGLDSAQVQALATRVGERIATDGEARARIDGLSFTIRHA